MPCRLLDTVSGMAYYVPVAHRRDNSAGNHVVKEGLLMKKILLPAVLFFCLCSCGSDEARSFLDNFLESVYTGKRTTAFLNRMHPVLAGEVRNRSLEIFSARENLPEKVSSHSLSGVSVTETGNRKFIHGLIKESLKKGGTRYRTFLAKFILQPPPGGDKAGAGIWIMYDLIIKKGKLQEAASALIRVSEPGETSLALLKNLPGKVNILVFDSTHETLSTHLLKALAAHSAGMITLEFLNPFLERGSAATYKITAPGYIVLTHDKLVYRINRSSLLANRGKTGIFQGERVLMTAIRRVLGHNSTLVYLTGHGERSLQGGKDDAWSTAHEEFKLSGFAVTTTAYLDKNSIGTNKVLCLAAPLYPPGPQEMALLKTHLTNGGAAVLFLEQPVPHPLAAQLAAWGIELLPHTIVDPANKDFIKGPTWFDCFVPDTPLTETFTGREDFKVLLGNPLGMRIKKGAKTPAHTFITTTTNGWAEASFEEDKPDDLEFSPGLDIRGPIALGYTIAPVEGRGRVLVYGDSDLISDRLFTSKISNWVFVLNSLGWLADSRTAAIPVSTFTWQLLQSFL